MSSMSTYSFGFRTSPVALSTRPPSVYGGAGGNNVRVSSFGGTNTGFDLADALGGGNIAFPEVGLAFNEKGTMQNLNKRLASYLEKVRSLESANSQLEQQIHEWYEKQVPSSRDYSQQEKTITDLRRKIRDAILENARIILEIDNGKLAAEDFRIKMETELDMRQSVEADITRLRKALDDITVTRSDLEMKIERMKEELILMKKDHLENMAILRAEMNGSSVNVEVDAVPQSDLSEVMVKMREQYEAIILKNRQEMEIWYKGKYEELNKQVSQHTELIQTSRSEASDLKRTLETLEIELQSEHSRKRVLENTLCETESCYCQQLAKLQTEVNRLEEELARMRMKIEHQDSEFRSLLNIKTRLEMEIAEYRRLLEGGDIQHKVVEVEKPESIRTKKIITVVEEVVDGKVVSHTEDVDVQVVTKE
uniref:Keratin 97 n=1 Tax=Paramormyrops kingsleyae TaxID=1676925 RepID=A0A3B3RZH0_9TELE|nr:keratin, type I cytoskeletal 13-like [Paramormyrops kingsleyae]